MKKKVFLTSDQFVELFKLRKSGISIKALSKRFGQKAPAISRNLYKMAHSLSGGRLPVTKGGMQLRMAITELKKAAGQKLNVTLAEALPKTMVADLQKDQAAQSRLKLVHDMARVIDAYVDEQVKLKINALVDQLKK